MGRWNFRRSIRLAPGVRINLGSRSVGLSAGPRGAKIGVNSKRGAYSHLSVPGTGIYRRDYLGNGTTPPAHSPQKLSHDAERAFEYRVAGGIVIACGVLLAVGGLFWVALIAVVLGAGLWANARGFGTLVRRLFGGADDSGAATSSTPPEEPFVPPALRFTEDSDFVLDHSADLEACADADGDIVIGSNSAEWIRNVEADAFALCEESLSLDTGWAAGLLGNHVGIAPRTAWAKVFSPLEWLLSTIYTNKQSYGMLRIGDLGMLSTVCVFVQFFSMAQANTEDMFIAVLGGPKPIRVKANASEEFEHEGYDPETFASRGHYKYLCSANIPYEALRPFLHRGFIVVLVAGHEQYKYAFPNGVR